MKLGSKMFHRRCPQNQERLVKYERLEWLPSEEANPGLYDTLGLPNILNHPISL